VPEPGNPQSLNRYSWVLGNPLRYVDPTGYKEEGACPSDDPHCDEIQPGDIFLENNEDWRIPGDWDHAAMIVFVDPEHPNVVWIVEAGGQPSVWMHRIDLNAPRDNAVDWVILRVNTTPEKREAAARWAEMLAGWSETTERTKTSGEARFVSMFPFKDSPWGFLDIGAGVEGYYCFEVVADAYGTQGVDVTGRTQNLEAARKRLYLEAGSGAIGMSSYTALSFYYAITPIFGQTIYNSPHIGVVAR
jgi:hypothetical protein